MKLFDILRKRSHKDNSYRGTQGLIKPDSIKRSFSVVYHNHKWYSDITKFKLKVQKDLFITDHWWVYSIEMKLKKFKVGFDGGNFFLLFYLKPIKHELFVTFSTALSK